MKIKSGYLLRNVAAVNMVVPVGERVIDFKGMMSLNDSGAFLWKIMQNDVTEDDLVKAILEEYAVSEELARADVSEFVQTVEKAGALER